MLSNDSRRLKTQMPTHTALPEAAGRHRDAAAAAAQHAVPQSRRRHVRRGRRGYAGVQASGWSWSTMFMDVDLDGWQDILIANGHLWDIMDADTQERLQNRLTDVRWQRMRWEFPDAAAQERRVPQSRRPDVRGRRARGGGSAPRTDISHALAAGDLDGDGDLDVVVNRLGSPALVLRNDAAAPRVAVRLVGRRAEHARRRREDPAARRRRADRRSARSSPAGCTCRTATTWRRSPWARRTARRSSSTGATDAARRSPACARTALYEITTAGAVARPPADSARDPRRRCSRTRRRSSAATCTRSTPFDDWDRQFLLPNALSQLGPGRRLVRLRSRRRRGSASSAAGKGGRLGVFRNDRGRLVPQPAQGPVAPADFTTVLGWPRTARRGCSAGVSTLGRRARSPR